MSDRYDEQAARIAHRHRIGIKAGLDECHVTELRQDIATALRASAREATPRPLDDWHEGHGDVLWWRFPIEEPPYVGSPLDLGQEVVSVLYNWKGEAIGEQRVHVGGWPGHHTHWAPIEVPSLSAPPATPHLDAVAAAKEAVAAAAMTYARGPMSDTVGALRGLVDAARDLANAKEACAALAEIEARDKEME